MLDRIEHGIVILAETNLAEADLAQGDPADGAELREAMHAVRSALSDICALTDAEAHPTVLRAVERLAGQASGGWRRGKPAAPGAGGGARCGDAGAQGPGGGPGRHAPSRIAVSLGRDW